MLSPIKIPSVTIALAASGSRTPPEALQAGHSIQSLSPVALRFIPLHRFLSMIRLHFQFASWTLWPGVRQAVQQVTGICRFIGWGFYRIFGSLSQNGERKVKNQWTPTLLRMRSPFGCLKK
jgi:hypothetical protein